MIADDDEVDAARRVSAPTHVVTKDEFAAAIAEPRVTGEHPFVDPEEVGRAALHQRHDVGAQGGGAAPPASGVLHHLERRVPRVRGRRGAADLRAAVPHRRHRGGAELALRGAAHHVPADVRRRRVGAPGRRRAHHPRHGGADHARADPRRGRGGAASSRRRCATSPTAAGACRSSWSSGRCATCPTSTWSTPTG